SLDAFSTAGGTSLALPYPQATLPCLSPTTTRALKLKRRPPLTTAAQRRIFTTRSSKPSCRDSRSLAMNYSCRVNSPLSPSGEGLGVRGRSNTKLRLPRPFTPNPSPPEGRGGQISSELQPAFAGGVGEGLDPAVVAVVAAVEGGLGNALALGGRG